MGYKLTNGGSAAMLFAMLFMRHKTRRVKFMVDIPLIILVQVAVAAFVFNQRLSVSYYNVETTKIKGPVKLALITDLHACYYGKGQRELLNAIEFEQPDAILLCGDIFDDRLPHINTLTFIEGVSHKYPCYYVSGNHEFWSGQVDEFKYILKSYGVSILEGTYETLNVRGDTIRISGIDDPDIDMYPGDSSAYAELSKSFANNYNAVEYKDDSALFNSQINQLQTSAETGTFTVLLSHRPERIGELLPLKADLVTAGHAHGGQWRIPGILPNGLFAPDQGLFPKYTNGMYAFGNTRLIVSRGLARESTLIPRVFNRPEVVVIMLEHKKL
jgi:predicted MPP superfamily phosphohydrolase